MPGILVSISVFEHGVCYGQTVASTEVQQQNTTLVQIVVTMPPNHASPSVSIIAQVCIKFPQQDSGVPHRSPTQGSTYNLQEGGIF